MRVRNDADLDVGRAVPAPCRWAFDGHARCSELRRLAVSDDGARRPLALYTAVTRPGTDKTVAGEDASFTLVQPVAPWPGGGS